MAQSINETKRIQQLAGVINENQINEEDKKQKFPEEVWGKLPPSPDQVKWDKILAHMASQYDGGYESKEDLILTIGGIAKGTTSSGAYNGWMNHKKTAQPQQESIEQAVNEALKAFRKGK
jgi:hypothetical protein